MVTDWTLLRIQDFATTSSGGTPSRSNPKYYAGDIRWVTTGELKDCYIFDTNEHITEDAIKNSSAKIFPAGTLLVAMYGATIGKLGIIVNDASTNQACCAIMPNMNAETKYLYYWFLYNRQRIVEMGCGAGQPNISQSVIKNLEIELPPIEEQNKIAEALSDIDNLIENTEKLIEKKKAIKQGVMQELLTGKRRLPGFTGNLDFVELETLCTVFADGDWIESKDQSSEGVRLVQTGNVGIGRFNNKSDKKRFISNETFLRLHCTEIFPGDVLVSRLPEPAGRACIIPNTREKMITAVDCTIIRFLDYPAELFVAFSQTPQYQTQIDATLAGSTRQRVSRKSLGKVKVPCFPTVDEAREIAKLISDMENEIIYLEEQLEKYGNLKQGMMSKLLTGEIRLAE